MRQEGAALAEIRRTDKTYHFTFPLIQPSSGAAYYTPAHSQLPQPTSVQEEWGKMPPILGTSLFLLLSLILSGLLASRWALKLLKSPKLYRAGLKLLR